MRSLIIHCCVEERRTCKKIYSVIARTSGVLSLATDVFVSRTDIQSRCTFENIEGSVKTVTLEDCCFSWFRSATASDEVDEVLLFWILANVFSVGFTGRLTANMTVCVAEFVVCENAKGLNTRARIKSELMERSFFMILLNS